MKVSIKKPIVTAIILSILLVSLPLSLASNNLLAIAAPSPPPINLQEEWHATPKNIGSLIGSLAAKLIPNSVGLQIVVTGGSSANDVDQTNSHGSITCLNGTNGDVIWQVDGYSVSIHQPFQIADLYNDGSYKVIVALWNQTIVLNGIDGSVNWTSIAPSGNTYPAIADVNGDGFLEIFVSSGNGPYRGSDWITMLSHDGTILRQAYTWHPCYGGLTVGDPNGDGKFVLFATDRSYVYAPLNDSYKGGGLGIRAFDAETLTPLWNYPIGFSSSHVPILADVNLDGKLDVIVGNEGNNGIDVFNALNGTILGGKTGSTDMPVHLQPTVADLDGDGHLEFIASNSSQPKIWDLTSWTSDGALFDEKGQPLRTEAPPKVGNVTGGRFLNIIASAESGPPNPYTNQYNKVYIYGYSSTTKKYDIISIVSNLSHSPGNFNLVADVDNDGKNELILTGGGGIYMYGTSVPTPARPPRTNLQFYSESNRGAAEYVAPPIPTRPVLKQEQPVHDSVNQPVAPTLSIKVVDYQKLALTVTFSTDASGTWKDIKTFANVQSGVYNVSTSNMVNFGTTYNWRVTATNSRGSTTVGNYRFTTYLPFPTQDNPILVQNAGASGKDLRASTTSSSTNPTTNIYSWYKNGAPIANLQLPFDSYTSTNPLLPTELLNDGFENGLGNWDITSSNWHPVTTQAHQGSYSVYAGTGSYYLISKPIDLSTAESVTISFWYRTHGSPEAYFMLWNGKWYNYMINLGSNSRENEWQYYSVQTYDPKYLNSSFIMGFDAVGFDSTPLNANQEVWIDDFQISTQTKTKDYSGNNINATIHGATWTDQGISGGAYNFNGVNNWISVPNTALLSGNGTWSEITTEFWIKPSSLQNGAVLLAKKSASEQTGSYMVGFERAGSPNTLNWGVTTTIDYNWHQVSVNTSIPVGTWSYVVCTYESGQGLTIYINGVRRANVQLSGNISLGPDPFAPMTAVFGQPLFIGSDGSFVPNTWFNGLIDEVKIYPIALTPTQILQQYNDVIGSRTDSTISYMETNIGEIWQSEVTPNDGLSDGLPQLTNPVRVGYPSVVWNLAVSSTHGNPNPGIGITGYKHSSSITASVTSPVVENNNIWECTGWTGSGSVPLSGSGLSTTFNITKDSSITWNWVQKSTPPSSPDQVATPTFSPSGGTYSSAQEISISCSTSGSTIRYTTNGDEPTSTSMLYSNTISLGNGTLTIKAKAFKSGLSESSTASATYTIEVPNLSLTVVSAHGSPTPVVGLYSSGQSVTAYVSSPVTENATIWTCTGWTGTGSVPLNGSMISVTFTITQNSTITWNWTSSPDSTSDDLPPITSMYAIIALVPLAILIVTAFFLKRRSK